MTCTACGSEIGPGVRFCTACGHEVAAAAYGAPPPYGAVPPYGTPPPTYSGVTAQLVRPRENRAIAGVCAGFSLRYGWDLTLVRVVLVVLVLLGAGTPIIAYLVAWAVMPDAPWVTPPTPPMAPPPPPM